MVVDVIRLVSGDDKPLVVLTLTDDISNTPYDLSPVSTTVFVRFRQAGTTDTLSTIQCTKLTTGADGKVQFNFVGGVLDVPPGMYEGEVVIDESGGRQTVYDLLRFRVRQNFTDPIE
jgi:hypothetical protein